MQNGMPFMNKNYLQFHAISFILQKYQFILKTCISRNHEIKNILRLCWNYCFFLSTFVLNNHQKGRQNYQYDGGQYGLHCIASDYGIKLLLWILINVHVMKKQYVFLVIANSNAIADWMIRVSFSFSLWMHCKMQF